MPQRPEPQCRETIFSCGPPFHDKPNKVKEKMPGQSIADRAAAKIRREPRWISHHLQDSDLWIALIETRLIKGLSTVTQGIVHENVHFAVLACLGIFQAHAAAKIAWLGRAWINVMGKVEQGQRIRAINAL